MITLVLGGARSGKSERAERLTGRIGEPATYLATGLASDPDMTARIEAHRRRRPVHWFTLECGAELIDALGAVRGTVLVDALGTWLTQLGGFEVDTEALCRTLRSRAEPTILVSDEVGMGVHPPTGAGRRFREPPESSTRRSRPSPAKRSSSSRAGCSIVGRPTLVREALGFLTSLGGPRRPTSETLAWLGPVGALLGLALGGLWWGAAQLCPRSVAAAVVVAADLAITGLLHLDGLVDAADGLLPHLSTERRLALMREPDASAFGVGVAAVMLLIRWSTLASLRPTHCCSPRPGACRVPPWRPRSQGCPMPGWRTAL